MSKSKPPPLIAFIDDDDGPMEFYEDALLDEGFEIKRIKNCIEAIEYIRTTDACPSAWLIDLMMPIDDDAYKVPGETETLVKASSLGLASGRILYRQIRKRFPSAQVVLFTHMSTPEILDELEKEMDDNARCEAKLDLMPDELVKLIALKLRHAS